MKHILFYAFIPFLLLSSCVKSSIDVRQDNNASMISSDKRVISDKGLAGYIEVDMPFKDFIKLGIPFIEVSQDEEFIPYLGRQYKINSLGVELNVVGKRIKSVIFFANSNELFKIYLPKDNITENINRLKAGDIIRNFGNVTVYDKNPPRNPDKFAFWNKYDPFNVNTNYIVYPDLPYLFSFENDNKLEYLTVTSRRIK